MSFLALPRVIIIGAGFRSRGDASAFERSLWEVHKVPRGTND
jgi:hypothetical protein